MKKRFGFTLLELLIVIAIIGILVAIGTASYSNAQKKSRDARRQGDLKAIQNAMEQYYANHGGNYPSSCGTIGGDTSYLPGGIPKDPKTGASYIFGTCNASQYRYCADLEGDGSFSGSEQDFCVNNLQ